MTIVIILVLMVAVELIVFAIAFTEAIAPQTIKKSNSNNSKRLKYLLGLESLFTSIFCLQSLELDL